MKILFYLIFNISLFGTLFSCESEYKNKSILKHVVSDFIKEKGVDMLEIMLHDSINNMAILISKQERFQTPGKHPLAGDEVKHLTYESLDIYTLCYGNSHFKPTIKPCRLFYIEGYPTMIEDKEYPIIDKDMIPDYLFKNENVWANDDDWMIVICKKSREYIIIRYATINYDDTIKNINMFNEKCNNE